MKVTKIMSAAPLATSFNTAFTALSRQTAQPKMHGLQADTVSFGAKAKDIVSTEYVDIPSGQKAGNITTAKTVYLQPRSKAKNINSGFDVYVWQNATAGNIISSKIASVDKGGTAGNIDCSLIALYKPKKVGDLTTTGEIWVDRDTVISTNIYLKAPTRDSKPDQGIRIFLGERSSLGRSKIYLEDPLSEIVVGAEKNDKNIVDNALKDVKFFDMETKRPVEPSFRMTEPKYARMSAEDATALGEQLAKAFWKNVVVIDV